MSRSDRADDGHWNSTEQPRDRTKAQSIEDTGTDTNADNNSRRDDDSTQSDTREPQATASERHAIRNGPPRERNPQTATGQHSRVPGANRSNDEPETTVFRLIAIAFAGFGSVLLYAGWLLIDNAGVFAPYAPRIAPSITALGLVVAGVGVVNLATAYGTWTFTPWGRRLGIWLAGLSLVGSLLTLNGTGAGGIIGFLLYTGIAWYLYDSREAYAQLRESQQRNTA